MALITREWMKVGLTGLCLLGRPLVAPAQNPELGKELFKFGAVLLASGDTVRGPLTYYPQQDVVCVVQANKQVVALSAAQVRIFAGLQVQMPVVYGASDHYLTGVDNRFRPPTSIGRGRSGQFHQYDPTHGMPDWRRAQVLPIQKIRTYRTLLWSGGAGSPQAPCFFEQLTNGPVLLLRRLRPGLLGYEMYFLARPNGEVMRLRPRKKDVLSYFSAQAGPIQEFVKHRRLRYSDPRALVLIVTFANLHAAQPAK
ncbi:hypothetical protein LJY25_00995 [Hymenobacter sp. BT175]|uniref:hypothetical protein n=1 Tax=Hymenobacter translucens TaxID=2886507 RepID=UPI001D0EF7B2|nr:hypothetical protein [Hymenobacter translucens]MCC2545006.1 hypothetical protein [Hymenobacter translucens]